MILGLGLDPNVGPVSYVDAQEEVFLASERQGLRQRVQPLSPQKSEQAYRSAVSLLWSMECYAIGMLRESRGALEALADLLLEKRCVSTCRMRSITGDRVRLGPRTFLSEALQIFDF